MKFTPIGDENVAMEMGKGKWMENFMTAVVEP